MGAWIGLAALAAVLWWLLAPRRRPRPAPEDDVTTAIDHAELEQAERELKEDAQARPQGQEDEDDDWGPGAPL